MALYEGIALIQEKQAVVLDMGTDYTKFGFTGEASPRCIIPSQFWCSSERRFKRVFDYQTPEELYDNLVNMLHLLYFRHVLVNPKERKVVVVESLLTPTLIRETLAKVLYSHYEVSGVIWADSARLCAMTLGTPITLVVSIGSNEAEVTAVVYASPVLRSLQYEPLAARAIHKELSRLLDEDNSTELQLPDHIIEDIKVKTCLVTTHERAELWASGQAPTSRSLKYPVPGREAITISGRTRELATEPLFSRDNELASLPDIILKCLMQCPIDVRKSLAENILITGGTACLPGLKARLAQELRLLVTQAPYQQLCIKTFKFHTAPAHDNCVAWLGGAIVGACDAGATRAMPRDLYVKEKRLKDWVNLLDNTPSDHSHRDWQGMC